ncbi:MAG: Stp1/IreP family PP2C-type Ser/Thr phosphatase [Ectothiorhodospira sp.]
MSPQPRIQIAAGTHPGRMRQRNEDTIGEDGALGLLVLADGMGGHAGGDVASRMAVATILGSLRERIPACEAGGHDRMEVLREAVLQANRAIHEAANRDTQYAGMGTTLAVALFHGDRVLLAHVGDSRIYRFRGDRLERLTTDHTPVQEMVDRGLCSPRQARLSAYRNLITRALGIEAMVTMDTREERLRPGDLYLLCSDGLHDMIDDPFIEALIRRHRDDPWGLSRRLIDRANACGGRDNISVMIARVHAHPAWYRRFLPGAGGTRP